MTTNKKTQYTTIDNENLENYNKLEEPIYKLEAIYKLEEPIYKSDLTNYNKKQSILIQYFIDST